MSTDLDIKMIKLTIQLRRTHLRHEGLRDIQIGRIKLVLRMDNKNLLLQPVLCSSIAGEKTKKHHQTDDSEKFEF